MANMYMITAQVICVYCGRVCGKESKTRVTGTQFSNSRPRFATAKEHAKAAGWKEHTSRGVSGVLCPECEERFQKKKGG